MNDQADTDMVEFDRITEAAEAQREIIDSRVSDLWNDKGVICQVIEENIDTLNQINQASYDVAGDIEKAIDDLLKTMVENELNL